MYAPLSALAEVPFVVVEKGPAAFCTASQGPLGERRGGLRMAVMPTVSEQ